MRKAPIITMDEFKDKIKYLFVSADQDITEEPFPYDLPEQINKDLRKVNFDWENYTAGDADPENNPKYFNDWDKSCGYKLLKNNLPVVICSAGGDWEDPVYFILYWDGKKVRAYIPKEGNTYHLKSKAAWGSHNMTEEEEEDEEDENTRKFDYSKFEEDIVNRIQIV